MGRPAHTTQRRLVLTTLSACLVIVFWGGPTLGQPVEEGCAQAFTTDEPPSTDWADPVDGAWNDPARWSDGVPDADTVACIAVPGTYTVTIPGDLDAEAASLEIGNPDATLRLEDGATLGVVGDLFNGGAIAVGSASAGAESTRTDDARTASATPQVIPPGDTGIGAGGQFWNAGPLWTEPTTDSIRHLGAGDGLINVDDAAFNGPTSIGTALFGNEGGTITINAPTEHHGPAEGSNVVNSGTVNVHDSFDLTTPLGWINEGNGLLGFYDHAGRLNMLADGSWMQNQNEGTLEFDFDSNADPAARLNALDLFAESGSDIIYTPPTNQEPPPIEARLHLPSAADPASRIRLRLPEIANPCFEYDPEPLPIPVVRHTGEFDPLEDRAIEVLGLADDPRITLPAVPSYDVPSNTVEVEPECHQVIDVEVGKAYETVADPPDEGRTVAFAVVVRNAEPPANTTAEGVEVTDELPEGFTYLDHNASQGTYDPDSDIWAVGGIPQGGLATLVIEARQDEQGPHTNCAFASAYNGELDPDSDPGFNLDEDDTDCVELDEIDIEVDKAFTDLGHPTPDDPREFAFIVTATNNGEVATVDATDVVVADPLPDGLAYVDHGTSKGDYDPDTGLWDIGDLAPGETVVLDLAVEVSGDTAQVNCAHGLSYTGYDHDSDPGNFDPAIGPVEDDEDCVDLAVKIDVDKTMEDLGQASPSEPRQFLFTVTVTNDGDIATVDATQVQVTDELPDGLSHASDDPSTGTYDPTSGIWDVGDLAPGQSETLELVADVDAPSGPVDNCAHASRYSDLDDHSSPGNFDPDVGPVEDDEDCERIEVDVQLAKVIIDEAFNLFDGHVITFAVTVSNGEGATVDATQAEITEVLPDGLELVEARPAAGTTYDTTTGVWDVGTLAPGEEQALELDMRVVDGDDHRNCAFASSYSDFDASSSPAATWPGDPQENDEDCADVAIKIEVDKVLISDERGPEEQRRVTYLVGVTNAVPTATIIAFDVEVTDALPAELAHVGHDTSQGSYAPNTGVWDVGALAPGGSATLEITADVVALGPVTNCAHATDYDGMLDPDSDPGNFDPDVGPDEDDEDCHTLDELAIAVDKTVDDDTPTLGQTVTFTVEVANEAPHATITATDLLVREHLPEEGTVLGATTTQGSFAHEAGSRWLWTVGDLAPGASATLEIDFRVEATGEFANCAEADAYDGLLDFISEPGNLDLAVGPVEDDEDCVELTVSAPTVPQTIRLSLDKTVDDHTPDVDDEVTYTLEVRNADDVDGTAFGVEVTEYPPVGVTLLEAEASDGTTYDADETLWVVGPLTPGQSETLELRVRVDDGGPQRNCAEVSDAIGNDPDSTPGNFDPDERGPEEPDEACVTLNAVVDDVEVGVSDDDPAAGDEVTVSVVARDADGNPLPDQPVDVDVDGANGPGFHAGGGQASGSSFASHTGPRQVVTGPDGTATVTYTGHNPGDDAITAHAGDATATLALRWRGDATATRLAGPAREETAVAVSQASFPVDGSAAAVVLARRDSFADSLAGTPFARRVDAPLLITATGSLHPATRAELTRVLPAGHTVYLLGGTAALSDAVAAEVADLGYTVERLGGATRFETATIIGARLPSVETIFVADGFAFPDALAAGPAAITSRGAVVLANRDRAHPATDAFLAAHAGVDVVAVGGPAATAYPDADGVAGATREHTAALLADAYFGDAPVAGVARRDDFADALAGGVHAGRLGGPVLLTSSTALHPDPADWLDTTTTLTQAYLYGGTAALADDVRTAVQTRLR